MHCQKFIGDFKELNYDQLVVNFFKPLLYFWALIE